MWKFKFYLSFLKERDWLEDMARQGWFLEDITLGCFYKFHSGKPADKVYEVERFALPMSGNAGRKELLARKTAFDIAEQMGWKLVTHDETLNYYFVKDRAGDETDEFYDDEESRRSRAENYRKYLTVDMPKTLLGLLLIVAIIYIVLFFLVWTEPKELIALMGILIALTVLEVSTSLFSMKCGEQAYQDLLLSREQWEQQKKYSEKKKLKTAQDIMEYLNEKDEAGLRFTGYEQKTYRFLPASEHYRYYVDTCQALRRRKSAAGDRLKSESKDVENLSTKWHEQSMEEAAVLGLDPVCCIGQNTMIYRRRKSLPEVTWENGVTHETTGGWLERKGKIMIIAVAAGFLFGLFMGFFGL